MAERERSPNYPAYSLENAIVFARQAYNYVKRVAVPMEALARALGSSGLSGPARSKIAALRTYGLVEPAKDGLRISDRAMTLILRKPGDQEFTEAARAAMLAPALFAELADERASMDDEQLQFYLVRDRGFSEDGARRAIKSFRETAALAGLGHGDALPGPIEASPKEMPVTATVSAPIPQAGRSEMRASNVLNLDLPGVFSGSVAFARGEPTAEEIEQLIQFLTWTKTVYAARKRATPSVEAETKDTLE